MSITVNGSQFQLNTKNTSYVMQICEGYLIHTYWGSKLNDGDHGYMHREYGRAAFCSHLENCRGLILDDVQLEYPAFGRGDLRSPAIEVINADGSDIVDPKYDSYRILDRKPLPEGLPASYGCPETLVITLKDSISDVTVELYYSVFADTDVIARRAVIINNGRNAVSVRCAMSASVDFDTDRFDIISNIGSHARERHIDRFPLKGGKFSLYSRRGASSHVHNPFMILTSHDATEDSGDAYSFTLVYSGSFTADAEATQFGCTRVRMGINPDGFSWKLENGEKFDTPEAILCHSTSGLTALSQNMHSFINNHIIRGKYKNKTRPVLLNSWEACYFGFNEERLIKIAECSAKLGIELLVIDDGWFGKRDSDNCSLGDWVVDKRKLPGGIEAIHDVLKKHGMTLGIWFEPEMVSPDSDLYRAHPDWCLHIDGRPRSEGRQQLMLNLSRKEVCDYLYDSIAAVLKNGAISYVKWDFNRNMSEVGSGNLPVDRQQEVSHRYYLGLYSLLERLVTDFPDVLFESCSGGGGRFDCGMLYYMPQTWTSDNSDAIERLPIQHGTSLVYPLSSMSAHVSASPNHQTGHVTPFDTRFNVAFTGSFGYELDPTALSEEEQSLVRRTAEFYKKYSQVAANGRYFRLRSCYEGDCAAWEYISDDDSICIAEYVLTHVRVYPHYERLKLKGLDPDARYRDDSGKEYTGSELMGYGIPVDLTYEYSSKMWVLEKIK